MAGAVLVELTSQRVESLELLKGQCGINSLDTVLIEALMSRKFIMSVIGEDKA